MRTLLFILLCCWVVTLNAQNLDTLIYNFEQNDTIFSIEIDTTNPNNIWQVGPPQKSVFDSAYSLPNAIVTDTVNPYPVNDTSSFVLTFSADLNTETVELTFTHKINSTEGMDGGYIEAYDFIEGKWVSINKYDDYLGNQDTGLSFEPPFVENLDTLANDSIGFSGNRDWNTSFISLYCLAAKNSFDYKFRFSFYSDSIPDTLGGWIIDDFKLIKTYQTCSGIEKINTTPQLLVYPNPAQNHAVIGLDNGTYLQDASLEIYTLAGRLMLSREKLWGNEIGFDASALPKGLYQFVLREDGIPVGRGKFGVQ